MSESYALMIVLLVGFLPTEIWRTLAVFAGRQVEEGSEVFLWVRAVATALLAAVVARLLFVPAGPLMAVPLLVRLGSVAFGIAIFTWVRRSLFLAILGGEVLLILAAMWFAP
ncbi:AzlD domain-containing protein [Xanthobacter sp. TB0136]|uniref:AzlD domain-containing protein n=1 Tax=Xanthobacter sp. TB0136 TaxID=3459177 RepID=UPI004039DE1D